MLSHVPNLSIMTIHLTANTTVRQIRNEFSIRYPYLKLVFLHPLHQPSPDGKLKQLPRDVRLCDVMKVRSMGPLEVHDWNTIADVEALFRAKLGVNVAIQVLQYSDGHWVMPEETDRLTLKEQNEKASMAADHTNHPEYDSRIEDGEY